MRMSEAAGLRLARRRALLNLLWRSGGWRMLGVGVLAVAQGLAPTGAILATGLLIDAAHRLPAGAGASPQLVTGLALFGGSLLAGVLVAALLNYLVPVLDGRYGQTVHQTIARATLHTRGVAQLENPRVVGELSALEEFERADGFVLTLTYLRTLVQRRSTGVSAALVLFTFSWWAPLVMLAAWRGLGYGIRQWIDRGVGLSATVGARSMRRPRYLRSLAVDAQPAKEVRLFGLADWLVGCYVGTYQDALRQIWAGRVLGMRTVLLATSGVLAAHSAVLGTLSWQAMTGALSVAQLVVAAQAVLSTSALGYLGEPELALGRARQVAWQALRLERELLAVDPATEPMTGAVTQALPVQLTDVSFSYPDQDRLILDGLNLDIPAGQSIAIIGANGAGKSTIIKLLCGLYQPNQGQVRIGGAAATEQRGRIGVIFQNFTRYELSLRANVGFGNPAADQRVLTEALAKAGAADLVERLPAGWDTVLSAGYPNGQDLSGGQWQKVALARALVAVHGGAGLLVLDEPTAALDVRAEAELFDRFRKVTKGVTTILVSHRLASVCRADRIVVVAEGRVAEDGTHEELMALGGRYATMFTLQAQRFAVDPDPDRAGQDRAGRDRLELARMVTHG